jgi:hypothetical protein
VSCNRRCWYILWPFGQFSGHFVYFMALKLILWSFGIFSPFWYIVPRKIWQPCFLFPWRQFLAPIQSGCHHRNLRTRRKMNLCMQDDQISLKFMVLAPADMARLPHMYKKIDFSSKRPTPSAGTMYTYFELALLYKGNCPFWLDILLLHTYFLDFYGCHGSTSPPPLFALVVLILTCLGW